MDREQLPPVLQQAESLFPPHVEVSLEMVEAEATYNQARANLDFAEAQRPEATGRVGRLVSALRVHVCERRFSAAETALYRFDI